MPVGLRLTARIFQFTPLREGRRSTQLFPTSMKNFNSRLSARGDDITKGTIQARLISIHAPPRGATAQFASLRHALLFQFTPLREGRQYFAIQLGSPRFISIHAPPRGATTLGQKALKTGAISIHAPPRGATIADFRIVKIRAHFNSRPSARGDDITKGTIQARLISIHAPPRGATCTTTKTGCNPANFNSRPSARGDGGHAPSPDPNNISIHAPPRGATIC